MSFQSSLPESVHSEHDVGPANGGAGMERDVVVVAELDSHDGRMTKRGTSCRL